MVRQAHHDDGASPRPGRGRRRGSLAQSPAYRADGGLSKRQMSQRAGGGACRARGRGSEPSQERRSTAPRPRTQGPHPSPLPQERESDPRSHSKPHTRWSMQRSHEGARFLPSQERRALRLAPRTQGPHPSPLPQERESDPRSHSKPHTRWSMQRSHEGARFLPSQERRALRLAPRTQGPHPSPLPQERESDPRSHSKPHTRWSMQRSHEGARFLPPQERRAPPRPTHAGPSP